MFYVTYIEYFIRLKFFIEQKTVIKHKWHVRKGYIKE